MTLSQLEYLILVAEVGHFGRAAEQVDVTQPTLSMMIKKLEDELGVVLLDRNSKPITPTKIGAKVIQQAKNTLAEAKHITDIITNHTNELQGNYTLGVIPTIATYVVPLLVDVLMRDYPNLRLKIVEEQTDYLIQDIITGEIDGAILATPTQNELLVEMPLFYEEFFLFGDFQTEKKFLLPSEIDTNELWLLEEGHCLRSQVINLCELKETESRVQYNSGSLETLIEIVRKHKGMTILPELTVKKLSKKEQNENIKMFQSPAPFREMSLVVHKNSAKHKFFEAIQDVIEETIPKAMRILKTDANILPISLNDKS